MNKGAAIIIAIIIVVGAIVAINTFGKVGEVGEEPKIEPEVEIEPEAVEAVNELTQDYLDPAFDELDKIDFDNFP